MHIASSEAHVHNRVLEIPAAEIPAEYALVNYALALGWPRDRILVIDDDQGLSGTSAKNRKRAWGPNGHGVRPSFKFLQT